MSGKRRIVPVVVDEEWADGLYVEPIRRDRGDIFEHGDVVPVPPDDQLTRDVDLLTEGAKGAVASLDIGHERAVRLYEAAARLRATFHLDERPSLDDVLSHGRARFDLDEGTDDE